VKCSGCGKSTGMSNGVCLPCQVGLTSVRGASLAFRKVCQRCGEPLTSIESRRRGYGPKCWLRVTVWQPAADGSAHPDSEAETEEPVRPPTGAEGPADDGPTPRTGRSGVL
jgi:hypothetical protein